MASPSFKQEKLYSSKDVDYCLQMVARPMSEHVYFPVDTIDPLETEKHHQYIQQLQNLSVSDTLACATCQVQFSDRTEQTIHFKSDWHRLNIKRKIRNQAPISSEKFEDMERDLSSISGSDSTSDDEDFDMDDEGTLNVGPDASYNSCARNNPKVIFTLSDGRHISMYRCLLHGKKNVPQESQDLVLTAQRLPLCIHWCITMAAGGHFAIALFERNTILQHKTFHKYVVRAKQGTAQSAHDQKTGGKARSAGANLRRQNMLHLKQKIQELFLSWKNEIQRCSLIFVRAPSFNQHLLFGEKNSPLSSTDPRIRSIPFATLRPTFTEIQRVHNQLTKVEIYPSDYPFEQFESEKTTGSNKSKTILKSDLTRSSSTSSEETNDDITKEKTEEKKSKSKIKKTIPVPVTTTERKILSPEDLHTFNELFTACRLNDTQRFDDVLSRLTALKTLENRTSIVDILNYQTAGSLDTLLHIVSERGHLKLVQRLLDAGAKPSLANHKNLYPYNLCKTKETKETFRLFRHEFPDKYDYTLGQVAPALSSEDLERQRVAERERRRQTKKRRNEKQRSDHDRVRREQQEDEDRRTFLSLTDSEKRTLAVKVNFETQKPDELHLGRCWQCAQKISDDPFTYYDYKFCSTSCLKLHRNKLKTVP